MIRPPIVMSVPFVLRNLDPRAAKPGGFFSSLLGFGHASTHLGALGWVRTLGTWLEGSSFFACGGLGHHHLFTVHHGNLQLAFPSPQAFVDSTVRVVGSFFTGQLLLHAGHPGTE